MSGPPLSPARRAGPLVFTSGQLARGDDGQIVAGGIEAQAEQALANLIAVLAAEGCTLLGPIHRNSDQVSTSTVVSALLADGALIEVEAIAQRA